jgi:hypothetical protein
MQAFASRKSHLCCQFTYQFSSITPRYYPPFHAIFTFNKKVFAIPSQMCGCSFAPFLILRAYVMLGHPNNNLVHECCVQSDFPYTCPPKKFPTILAVGWTWTPAFTPCALRMQHAIAPPASFYDATTPPTLVAPHPFNLCPPGIYLATGIVRIVIFHNLLTWHHRH